MAFAYADPQYSMHVQSLRRIPEQCRVRQNTNCVAVFVDFSKALDSVSRARMELILSSYGIPRKIVKAIIHVHVLVHKCHHDHT